MKSEKDKDRAKRWRAQNPEKVKEQRRRYKARARARLRGEEVPPIVRAKQSPEDKRAHRNEYDRKYKERNIEEIRRKAREKYHEKRRAAGFLPRGPKLSDEELRERELERKRRYWRENPDKRRQYNQKYRDGKRQSAKEAKPKLDAERARRAAEVQADKVRTAAVKQSLTLEPVVCPDPPELQALFKKASKGEPARPLPPWHKKKTAFQIRGWV